MGPVPDDSLHEALLRHFGFRSFRPGQEAVVRSVLGGRDTLAVMPTGAGKSLCFQLPALLAEGTTLVVSPLIALMKDQTDGLSARRIPATFLNSTLTVEETAARLAGIRSGRYRLVYIAPERFRNARFLETLSGTRLAMLAIDEAHCISQWGHDFRPDYLHLGEIVRTLPPSVRILAVTATATDAIRRDIVRQLHLAEGGRGEPAVFVNGFSRPNLCLNVTRVRTHGEKLERVLSVIECFGTGIVYCATRRQVERVRQLLAEHGVRALTYSGGLEDAERTRVQDAFMSRGAPVVVATNAFGMGVDRQDIRFVMHWDVPGSVEAYYQEVGRAGRDGAFAWCELLYNYADVRTQEFFIASANPPSDMVYEFYAAVRNACRQAPDGEAVLSEAAWAEQTGIKATATVRNLIALFERNGLVLRGRRTDTPDPALRVPAQPDMGKLRAICAALAVKEENDRGRLREMLRFVAHTGCRHRFLLSYFGDEAPLGRCTQCDVCAPPRAFPPKRFPDEARLTRLRKILSCIVRMHGRGDFETVAAVLRGEDAAFRELTTYGILTECPARDIVRECRALELDGYILGMRVLARGYDLALGRSETVPVSDYSLRRPGTPAERRRRPAAGCADSQPPPMGLHAALRAWAREEAGRRGVPPFCILKRETLAQLAKKRPATLAELELVPGMGPLKIAKYGEALLGLIASVV